jgi:hypothetical protein
MNNLITSQSVLLHIWDKHHPMFFLQKNAFFNHTLGKYLVVTRLKNRTVQPNTFELVYTLNRHMYRILYSLHK